MEAKQVLEAMSDYLQTNNIFKDMIKEGVWALVKFLKTFINALEGAIDAMYNTLTLSVNSVMTEHMSSVGVIAITVLGVAICVLGYKFMFKRDGNKSNSFTGVLLVLVVCMGLPMIFEAGLGLFNSANGDKNMKSTFAEQIIQSNVVDLAESINDKDFGVTGTTFKPKKINNATMANIKYVDITESLNKKSKKHFEGSNVAANSKILDKELYYGKGGEIKDVDFDGNKITQKDGYYRYQANWFAIICSFVIVTVTLVLMSIKVAKILFQMVLDRIVGTILIFSDLEEGKRAKEMLNHVIATFTMLLVSVVSMDIYIGLVSTFATNIQAEGSLTKTLSQILVLLGTSLGLLEGSQVLEKLMGTRVDGGLGRTAAGLYGMGKMAQGIGSLGKGAGKTVMSAGKTAMSVGKTAGGVAKRTGEVMAKPIKYASDKTGATDKINEQVGKVGEQAGKVKEWGQEQATNYGSLAKAEASNLKDGLDSNLEKFGEKVGFREPSDESKKEGTKEAGFKPVAPIGGKSQKGGSAGTGINEVVTPLNTGTSGMGESSITDSNEVNKANTNNDFYNELTKHESKSENKVKNTQIPDKPKNKKQYPLYKE